MGKPMIIPISFKESERYIYEEICKHSGKGAWVKDVLAEHIKNQNSINNNQAPTHDNNDINVQGF